MNKKLKVLLAILGATESVFYILTPILLILLLIKVFGWYGWGSYLIMIVSIISTLFRAIKIGFLKQ